MENIENIETVLIVVQIDGRAHQVLASHEMKIAALHLLMNNNALRVSQEVMPFELELKNAK